MATKFIFKLSAALILLAASSTSHAQMLAGAAWAQPQGKVVQKNSTYGAVNTINLAFSSPVTAGNILVACVSANGSPTITDDRANVWTLAARQTGLSDASCWYVKKAVGATTTITANNGAGFIVLNILEISGMLDLEQVGTATNANGTALISTGGDVEDNEPFIIAYAHDWNNYATWTPSAGYTMELLTDSNGSGYISALATKQGHGRGVQSATFTKDFAGDQWCGVILTFRRRLGPPPRLVQKVSAVSSSGAIISATLPAPVGAGHLLVACATASDPAGFSISDDLNGSYVAGESTGGISCKTRARAVSGTTTVTAVASGSPFITLSVFEVSGVNQLMTGTIATTGALSTLTVTASAPYTNTSAFVLGLAAHYWTPVTYHTWGVSGGYTIQDLAGLNAGKYRAVIATQDRTTNLSGTPSITFTSDSPIDYFGSILLVFE